MERIKRIALMEPFTYNLSLNLALRIYPDNRPKNLDIASIHKSLILIHGGEELVEEGSGFGLPIVKFRDKTIFPGSATLTILEGTQPPIIVKTYKMDRISVKKLGGYRVRDSIYQPLDKMFSKLYLSLGGLRPFFDAIISLRDSVGIRTRFEATKSRGEVEVRYTLKPDGVEIEAKPRLRDGFEELVLLNEQGASTFRRYSDEKCVLVDKRMGAWDKIEFGKASMSTLDGKLFFTVEKPAEATFWRGRESVRGMLSWSGLELSFKTPKIIRYKIWIGAECVYGC